MKQSLAASLLSAIVYTSTAAAAEPLTQALWSAVKTGASDMRVPEVSELWRDHQMRAGWCDELLYYDWAVQRNVETNECRLLNPENEVVMTGTFDECRAKLRGIRRDKKLPELNKSVVLVIHGLGDWHLPNAMMADSLRRADQWTVMPWRYSSRRASISDHAMSLKRVLENLDGVEKIYIVAHSMGNLVLRHYWCDQSKPDPNRPGEKLTPDRRIERVVMVGPPNQGALIARYLSISPKLMSSLQGVSGMQLAGDWAKLEPCLATPTCEFAIIAGGRGNDDGYNPILPGDDDTLVCVSETKLKGSKAYVCLPVLHQFQMSDKTIQNATVEFFRTGAFPELKNAIAQEPVAVK
jgi:pimeloyl-ACP methyl ester carboxylesterase